MSLTQSSCALSGVKPFIRLGYRLKWCLLLVVCTLLFVLRTSNLFLITDAYSRKIIGHHVSDDMKVSSAVVALKKALAQKPAETIVIHHSDRGVQYCSHEYVNLLEQNNSMISMTQSGDPLENAVAERVNGILKTELISSSYEDIDKGSLSIA